jgi:hypothetical protein
VRIAAPLHLSLDAIRAFAIGKLGWIREQQRKLQEQEREPPASISTARAITCGGGVAC